MAKETYYVATSIPYVNAVPHIGFAYELLIGDVLARYHKGLGKEVFFGTGTDEHGGKIQEKAKELGITPQQLADRNAVAFADLAPVVNAEFSKFIRTSDKDHEKRAQQIWEKLTPFIYKANYVGMYDTREETFVTIEESKVMINKDPERYDRLKKIEEENYFFKLSEFAQKIGDAIESGELRVVPKTKRNEIMNLLKDGLDDISVSRPAEKIPWGIPVPGDKSQTIYVWFEALMNYITNLGYPDGADFKKFWPCDVHVIGKDILRFHAAIWPAMLLALGEKLPKDIYVHGFITVESQKMSKSVGNVVSPLELVSRYSADATRYYLLRHIPSYDDGDFSWEKMQRAYDNELANELGNLVQRTANMVEKYVGGEVGNLPESAHDEGAFHKAMQDYRFDQAIEFVWTMVRSMNQYIEREKPWQLAKNPDEADHLRDVLAYLVSTLHQSANLLSPFMPDAAERILKIMSGKVSAPQQALFPKLAKDD